MKNTFKMIKKECRIMNFSRNWNTHDIRFLLSTHELFCPVCKYYIFDFDDTPLPWKGMLCPQCQIMVHTKCSYIHQEEHSETSLEKFNLEKLRSQMGLNDYNEVDRCILCKISKNKRDFQGQLCIECVKVAKEYNDSMEFS